jgi:plastocyanin
MRRHSRRAISALGIVAVAAVGACGGGNTAPSQSPAVIAKAASKSGDLQTGPVGQALPVDLRVVVTRDGKPASDVAVAWSTPTGTMTPASDQTDTAGASTSNWTLGDQAGSQTATASVTGSQVTFTATATTPLPSGTIVQVLGPAGGNRFSPADISVGVGVTVTWQWGDGALSHSVVPDDGATPGTSGAVVDAPHTFQYTFNVPGVFHYHCASHGASGGIGMSGTVTVLTSQP